MLVCSHSLRVAGKPDVKGVIRGGRKALVETKSWQVKPSKPKRDAVLQVAGYRLMVEEYLGEKTDLGVVVVIPGDGTYRAFEVEDKDGRDRMIFRCIASVWADRNAHGLIDNDRRKKS